MTALATALSFLGLLAFVGFVLWLRAESDADRKVMSLGREFVQHSRRGVELAESVLNMAKDVKAAEEKVESLAAAQSGTSAKLEALRVAQNTSLEATGKALADLVSRVRGCELKAGIRGVTRQPESGLPPEVQG